MPRPHPSRFARRWRLDPGVVFLNHGSFGACPAPVLQAQQRLREQLERDPVDFFARRYEPMLDAARVALGRFLGAPAASLVFVPNATAGVNTVLNGVDLRRGDEILVTDHGYNACNNAAQAVAARRGATVVVAQIPFPLSSAAQVTEAVLSRVTRRTRVALIDHVTSPTALVLPITRIVHELSARGIETLVDGAHAPGMLPLALGRIGAAWYTGNCHKWMCAPKGAGFLCIREDWRSRIRPLVVSHGANSTRRDRPRLRLEFDWTGTGDPTGYLCVPDAITFLDSLLPGGRRALLAHNRAAAIEARALLCERLGIDAPAPAAMIGAMAAVPIRPGRAEALQERLFRRWRIEVPVIPWPAPPSRLVRISCQAYNSAAQYRYLAAALESLGA